MTKAIPLNQPLGASASLDALLATRFGAGDLKLASARPAKALLAGTQKTKIRGRGMDFEEVRHYQPGDDVRSIDWRVTARTEIPHTKVYREERERPVMILCDLRQTMGFGSINCFKSVMAAHLAATLSWATLLGGDKVGSIIFNDHTHKEIRPKRSKSSVLEIIRELKAFTETILTTPQETQKNSLTQALIELRRIVNPGFNLHIISDFYDFDETALRELSLLSRHASITLFKIHDPLEASIKSKGPLMISNGHERLLIPAHSEEFQTQFTSRFTAALDQLTQAANRLGVPLINISTADNLQHTLNRLFGRKG